MEKKGVYKTHSVVFLISIMLLSISIMCSIGVWNSRSFYFDEYIYSSYLYPAQAQYCVELGSFLSGRMTKEEQDSFQSDNHGVYYYVTDDSTKDVFSNIPTMGYMEFSALPNIKKFLYINENAALIENIYSLIKEVPDDSSSHSFSGYVFIDIDAKPLLSGSFQYVIDNGFGLQRILYIESILFAISFILGGILLIVSLRSVKRISAIPEKIPLDVTISAPAVAAIVWIFIINTYLSSIKNFSYLSRRIILFSVLTALTFVVLLFLICLIFKIREYSSEKSRFKHDWENRLTKNTPIWIIGLVLQLLWYFVALSSFSPQPYYYDYYLMIKNNITDIIVHNAVIVTVFLFIRKIQRTKELYAEEVLRAAKEIANGDLEQTIPVTGTDRYAQIAVAANSIREGYMRALDEQKKSERLKYELVTNISHDLRTPLTSILNYIGLLKKNGTSDDIGRYLNHVDVNARKLNLIIEDLFELSKIESGNVELNISDVDIVLLLKQIAHEYEEQLKQNNLEIIMEFADERYPLQCDSLKIWRVFDNIINNAIKYSLAGTRIYVSVTRESSGTDRLLVSIKNIASYKMSYDTEELFLRFKRGDDSRSTEGSGLGLAIAKGLVQIHDGSIHIETEGDMFKVIVCL